MAFSDHPTSKKMTGKASNKESVPLHLQVRTPEFPGGQDALDAYIQNNLEYPELAENQKREGTVFIRFQLDINGRISNITAENSVGMGCDEAALSLVRSMPRWKPAVQGGKPVAATVRIPIRFHLY